MPVRVFLRLEIHPHCDRRAFPLQNTYCPDRQESEVFGYTTIPPRNRSELPCARRASTVDFLDGDPRQSGVLKLI